MRTSASPSAGSGSGTSASSKLSCVGSPTGREASRISLVVSAMAGLIGCGHGDTGERPSRQPGLHGGRLVAKRLKAHGVTKLFTLSGGHIFSIYDGCREEGIDIVDTRHEQTAAFAAEGWAKATRQPGVAALTAGPGVTNGMSALGSSLQNGSPMVVLGGRAPAMRWGQGSLQEIDHVPFVAPLTRSAATAGATAEIPGLVDAAFAAALGPPIGPGVRRLPARPRVHGGRRRRRRAGRGARPARRSGRRRRRGRARELLRGAERPVIMAGTGLYWAHGEHALRALAEELQHPRLRERPRPRLHARPTTTCSSRARAARR